MSCRLLEVHWYRVGLTLIQGILNRPTNRYFSLLRNIAEIIGRFESFERNNGFCKSQPDKYMVERPLDEKTKLACIVFPYNGPVVLHP
jgi:hypothetical protein